jgi:hypothetical protein
MRENWINIFSTQLQANSENKTSRVVSIASGESTQECVPRLHWRKEALLTPVALQNAFCGYLLTMLAENPKKLSLERVYWQPTAKFR